MLPRVTLSRPYQGFQGPVPLCSNFCVVLFNIPNLAFRLVSKYSAVRQATAKNLVNVHHVPVKLPMSKLTTLRKFYVDPEVDGHDEEEYSVVLTLGKRLANKFLAQHQSTLGTVFVDELAGVRLCGFALASDRLAKANTFVFNAKSSNCISEVSCSLSSSSLLLLKSVTSLFKPGEIVTHEKCLCLQVRFLFPLHINLVGCWLRLPIRANLGVHLECNLRVR